MTITSRMSEHANSGTQDRPRRETARVIPAALAAVLDQIPSSPVRRAVDQPIGTMPKELEEDGACRLSFEDAFFPDDFTTKARSSYCATCPVQKECMTWALRNEGFGIWGLTEGERAVLGGMRKRFKRTKPGAAVRAATRAIKGGIDPDNLVAALVEVHDLETPAVDGVGHTAVDKAGPAARPGNGLAA